MLSTLLLLLSAAASALADPGPEVKLGNGGTLRGVYQSTINGRKVAAFLGVPYAKRPQRFKMAEPVEQWTGVQDAKQIKPDCLQFSEVGMVTRGAEDCLYANIYVPENFSTSPKLMDVIIYIHGGAFSFKIGEFGPKFILEHDVVYIAFSYRLGPLGFMSTGDEVLPGNLGLKDQNMLLKWVQENIRFFGGNPERVLLTGTSAGGASVHYHMLSPLSKGLFHRAFSMSGSALCPWTQQENAAAKAKMLARNLGCPTSTSAEMIQCLSKKDGKEIVDQMPNFMRWGYFPFSPFGPVIEPYSTTAFIYKYPSEAIRDGDAMEIPWLTTLTAEEGLYPVATFIANDTILDSLDENWNELIPSLLDYEYTTTIFSKNSVASKIRSHYLGDGTIRDNLPGLIRMVSDRMFNDGVVRAAQLHAAYYKTPVYSYVFSYRGKHSGTEFLAGNEVNYGACHGDDTGFIFDNVVVNAEDSARDRRMTGIMTKLVVNFAATGKPSLRGLKHWPEICADDDFTFVNIKEPDSFEIVSNPKFGQMKFWSSLKLAED